MSLATFKGELGVLSYSGYRYNGPFVGVASLLFCGPCKVLPLRRIIDQVRVPEAAVAIVQTPEPGGAILLMRRAERPDDPWSGHWSLPGGGCEDHDTDPVGTALRELEEECGIRLGRESLAEELAPREARRPVAPFVLVAPFVFRAAEEVPAIVDLREAAEARWVPFSTLRDPANHRLQCVPGRPSRFLYPAVALHGTPLWGFTYRLLSDWLALGPAAADAGRPAFEFAGSVLDFLVERGLPLASAWNGTGGGDGPDVVVREAQVRGTIPVAEVLGRFSEPQGIVPPVNALEVQAHSIRIVGLGLEQYLIRSAG